MTQKTGTNPAYLSFSALRFACLWIGTSQGFSLGLSIRKSWFYLPCIPSSILGGPCVENGELIIEESEAQTIRMTFDKYVHTNIFCFLINYMNNHFHLVVKMAMDDLSEAMRRMEVSYAQYFNEKYERTGTLFQGRFGSEPIGSDEQFLAAVRYVHLNPEKASIAPSDAYEWSSYQSYIEAEGMVDTSPLLEKTGGIDRFDRFNRGENDSADFEGESFDAAVAANVTRQYFR